MKRVYACAVALTATGCVGTGRIACEPIIVTKPVEVQVPVMVKQLPPADLTTPLNDGSVLLPTFSSPSDPRASSALTPEHESRLRQLVEALIGRIRAWEAWARP